MRLGATTKTATAATVLCRPQIRWQSHTSAVYDHERTEDILVLKHHIHVQKSPEIPQISPLFPDSTPLRKAVSRIQAKKSVLGDGCRHAPSAQTVTPLPKQAAEPPAEARKRL